MTGLQTAAASPSSGDSPSPSPASSVPWASCEVSFPLSVLAGSAPVPCVEDFVRRSLAPACLPRGWSFSRAVPSASGGWAAVFSVSGVYPSLLDGCLVRLCLRVARLDSARL